MFFFRRAVGDVAQSGENFPSMHESWVLILSPAQMWNGEACPQIPALRGRNSRSSLAISELGASLGYI